jgi:para-nitrobenzyl esterase
VKITRSAARAGASVWQYLFDHNAPNGAPVAHGSEIAYVFEFAPDAGAAPLQAYWGNFAEAGDPNGEGLSVWPRYELDTRAYLEFANEGPRALSRLREPLCDWFAR